MHIIHFIKSNHFPSTKSNIST